MIGRSASLSVDRLCSHCQTHPKRAGKATKASQSQIRRTRVLVRAHLWHLMGMWAAQVSCFSLGVFCSLIYFNVGQTTADLRTLIVLAQLRIHNIQHHMCQCRRSHHLMYVFDLNLLFCDLIVPLQLDGGHILAPSNPQPQSFEYSGTTFETPNLDGAGLFRVPDMPEMAVPAVFTDPTLFNHDGSTLSVPQQDAGMTWMGVDTKPYKRHRGPAKQASFARAKNDPERIFARQQAKNQMVEWLLTELERRPGYQDFRDAFHSTQHNQGAVKSWTFVVEFKEAYNRLKLVVSGFVSHSR